MSELIYPDAALPEINTENELGENLFFANAPIAGLIDFVSGTEATSVSGLSVQNGEWYEQNELTTSSSTSWDIPYPYASLGSGDDSAFTMYWRIRIADAHLSSASVFFKWGTSELALQRYFDTLIVQIASSSFTVKTGIVSGDILDVFLVRDPISNVITAYVNGVAVTTLTGVSYTTLNNADVIYYHSEADQRGEGIAVFNCWVDRVLTIDEMNRVSDNPYALFKTNETVEQEYGLVCELDQLVELEPTTNKSLNFTLEVEFTLLDTASAVNLLTSTVGGVGSLYVDYNQAVRFTSGWSSGITSVNTGENLRQTFNKRQSIKITCVAGEASLQVNGVDYIETVMLTVAQGFRLPDELFKAGSGLRLIGHKLNYVSTDFPEDSRFWDFNQTRGDYVEDHYNGAIATLVGFPADSGYVRAYGVSDGMEHSYSNSPYSASNSYRYMDVGADTFPLVNDSYIELKFRTNGQLLGSILGDSLYTYFNVDNDLSAKVNDVLVFYNDVLVADIYDGGIHTFRLSRIADTLVLYLDGIEQTGISSADVTGQVITLTRLFRGSSVKVFEGFAYSAEYYNPDDSTLSRFYDYTKIVGNSLVVPETLNGQDGTMVGFPDNGVFVPEKNKTLVGQKFDGTQYVTITPPVLAAEFRIKFHFVYDEATNNQALMGNNADNDNICQILDPSTIYFRRGSGGVNYNLVTPLVAGQEYTVAFLRKADNFIHCVGSDDLDLAPETLGSNTSHTFERFCSFNGGTFFKGTMLDISVDDITTPSNSRYYDFTIETGNTIMDTSGNDNHGTVVGGELQRVYDYSGYGEIAGYAFDGITYANSAASLSEVSAIDVTLDFTVSEAPSTSYIFGYVDDRGVVLLNSTRIRFYSGSVYDFTVPEYGIGERLKLRFIEDNVIGELTLYINDVLIETKVGKVAETMSNIVFAARGNSLATRSPVIYHSALVKDLTNNKELNFDFTTGDQGKLVETIQGKHAIISNDSVVKWQPIVEVDVFTIGNDVKWDYLSFNAFQTARKTQPNKQKAIVYGTTGDTASSYIYNNNFLAGCEVVAATGYEWDLQGTNADFANIPFITNVYNAPITFRNMQVTTGAGQRATIDGCDNLASSSGVRNTLNSRMKGGSYTLTDTDYTITNSIITGRLLQNGGKSLTIESSISTGNATIHLLEGQYGYPTTISNSRFDQTPTLVNNMDGGGNLFSVDMSTWFTDSANGDYQITEDGRTAIGTDTGWNGNTICGWADAPIITVPDGNITVSFDDTLINTLLDDMVITNHTTVSFDDAVVTPVIENMSLQRTTALVFDDIVVGSSIDTLTLIRHTTVAYKDSQVSCTLDDMDIVRSTAVEFQDAVVGTTIENMVITVHDRLSVPLVFEDTLVSSVIEDMVIVRNTSVGFEDSLVGSTIEDMVITVRDRDAIFLEFEDTLVSTTIEDMSITVHDRPSIPLQFEDTLISLVGEDMDLVVTRTLQFENSVVGLTVEDMVLTGRQTSVEFENAIVNSIVNDMTLTGRTTSVSFDKTIVNSIVEDMAISRRAFLEFEDTVVNSKVEDMELKRYTSLVFEDAIINSTIDEMYLVTEQLPVFNNLKLKYDRIDRKLIKGHMPLITLTKQT
jgi:hypothetical protein